MVSTNDIVWGEAHPAVASSQPIKTLCCFMINSIAIVMAKGEIVLPAMIVICIIFCSAAAKHTSVSLDFHVLSHLVHMVYFHAWCTLYISDGLYTL